ncbi:MAG: hypothetical protein ACLQUY_02345 [Ktedonobacterales bacterium]
MLSAVAHILLEMSRLLSWVALALASPHQAAVRELGGDGGRSLRRRIGCMPNLA